MFLFFSFSFAADVHGMRRIHVGFDDIHRWRGADLQDRPICSGPIADLVVSVRIMLSPLPYAWNRHVIRQCWYTIKRETWEIERERSRELETNYIVCMFADRYKDKRDRRLSAQFSAQYINFTYIFLQDVMNVWNLCVHSSHTFSNK